MNNMVISIWGREFDLRVVYHNYPNETITSAQENSVKSIAVADFSSALEPLKEYIRKWNASELGEDTTISNIFRYVIPRSFLIPRAEGKTIFAVMCNYKFDMEHGIAILFENGECQEVGQQDIVL